ncbi:flavin reductase [Aquicoccus sp. SCR17]|nr:flavin reductase [Carideicomes alvinocaridis]
MRQTLINNASPVEPAVLRTAMARYATGVCIATALTDGGAPAGLTITSFNSLSLDPPLILWSLGLNSSNLETFRSSDRFGINILPSEMSELARVFSKSGGEKFAGVTMETGKSGVPLIAGALVQLECMTDAQYPAGDHILFLGRVISLAIVDGAPLVFCNSAFDTLASSSH